MRANRIVIDSPGPPSVLRYERHDIAAPAPHEVLLRQSAIGLNYIDIQHRTGRYPLPDYPSPIGMEGAGTIEAVGSAVDAFKPGDRVVYSSMPIGAYADVRLMPADRLVPLPPAIPDSLAAGIFTKGITAHYLIFTTFPVKAGDTILVYAAAVRSGDVGFLLGPDRADDGCAQVLGPLAENEADAARRRVQQEGIPGFEGINAPQQISGGQAAHGHRCRGFTVDARRKFDQRRR